MTVTDELRRMLNERGVEWERGLPTETIVRKPIDVLYVERPDGRMHAYVRSYLTPAQAIAATLGNEGVGRSNDGVAELGAGTCHDVGRHCFTCSECGHTTNEPHHMFNRNDPNVMPNFCPNCGRKVVDDG